MTETEEVKRAIAFATAAHGTQKRKYTGEPYINHPIAVAEIVFGVVINEAMIIAAILHDVVEDTEYGIPDIVANFGGEVGALVFSLTDTSQPEDGNRAVRKAIDREHIARGSADAHTIKLADILHNGYDIAEHDKDFAIVYFKEIELLMPHLQDGNKELLSRVNTMIMDFHLEKMV